MSKFMDSDQSCHLKSFTLVDKDIGTHGTLNESAIIAPCIASANTNWDDAICLITNSTEFKGLTNFMLNALHASFRKGLLAFSKWGINIFWFFCWLLKFEKSSDDSIAGSVPTVSFGKFKTLAVKGPLTKKTSNFYNN